MKIIKRNGAEEVFVIDKIINAIRKANREVEGSDKLDEATIKEIALQVEKDCLAMSHAPGVEEIQDMVENQIMQRQAFKLARTYITYRYRRALVRKSNSTDDQILSLIECDNEEVKQENSNKNPVVSSVQRDYMAGEVSKDISRRLLLD
ncbi:MAG: anaerobic ribonucleoside-triphosphate reductase, partial [Lachnospiraceae bacterium]|nr:anaerobic ribonucleoside-triphosphate reductase [Lachnospiraceae bacterium]